MHSQWDCQWGNTPWLRLVLLWLPLHAWCGLMMVHLWPQDENLMKCQESNSIKLEIDRQGLHMGNIIPIVLVCGYHLTWYWDMCACILLHCNWTQLDNTTSEHNMVFSVSAIGPVVSSKCIISQQSRSRWKINPVGNKSHPQYLLACLFNQATK